MTEININREIIYVITSGWYSDYGINAVFNDEDMAREFVDANGGSYCGDDYNIEEWYLNPLVPELRKGFRPYRVVMERDGTARIDTIVIAQPGESLSSPKLILYGGAYRNSHRCVLCGNVMATNEEHAVKIMNEKRTMLIANDKWKMENG